MRSVGLIALACWLAVARPAHSQDTLGTIEGRVSDSLARPVSSAFVTVPATSYGATTDDTGHYSFRVPVGFVTVVARRAPFAAGTRDSVHVRAGMVTRVNLALASAARRAVRVPCPAGAVAPDGGKCLPARALGHLVFEAGHDPYGVGMIRDAGLWEALRGKHDLVPGRAANDSATVVDWQREMLLIVGYGDMAQGEPSPGFNRAEVRHDSLVIVLGPDSLLGQRHVFVDVMFAPEVIAIPRLTLPVRYERRVPEAEIPAVRDWGISR